MKQKGKVKKKVGKFAKDSFRQSMQRTTPHVLSDEQHKRNSLTKKKEKFSKEKLEHT
jgi:hypothetical protein